MKVWGPISVTLRAVGEICALTLLSFELSEHYTGFEFVIFILALCGLTIGIIINAAMHWDKGRYRRNAQFAKAIPYINDAFSKIHSTFGNKKADTKELLMAFQHFCDRLSEAFSSITGKHCHVCIKISEVSSKPGKPEKYFAQTIAREKRNPALNHKIPDRKTKDNDRQHFFSDNTDFNEILYNIKNNKARYFFCENLLKKKGYKNSSFLAFDMKVTGPATESFLYFFRKKQNWPLPYKSTMVAAICPSIDKQNANDPLSGFLCVDSEDPHMFIEEDDIHLLIGCANGLFNAVEEYKQKLKSDVGSAM